MPFESAVLVDQVCWQMKASFISPRLRPDPSMELGCIIIIFFIIDRFILRLKSRYHP